MKVIFPFLWIVVFSLAVNAQTLSGRVSDADTKELLPGVVVYISDLKTGAVTDSAGHFEIKNLPRSRFIIQVRMLGYTTVTMPVDLSVTQKKDFLLKPAVIESPEVVVTGSAFTTDQSRTSVPVVPIDKIQITSVGAANLINAIATTPGVSAISTGNAVSKPVIRGLGYNRIVIVNEGVRQEGQQWGDEHGIEIDEFRADKIEILKGPSSLLYGSDALGGVINILEPVPAHPGSIRGTLASRYNTNNGLASGSLMVEGNHRGFVWRARGTYRNSTAYRTPAERVFNSGFSEINGDAMMGINRHWGFSHLHLSRWESNIGMIEGERDSASGKLLDPEGNIASDEQLKSRKIYLPNQNITHDKLSLVSNIILGKSQLRINGGIQQNNRKEFAKDISGPELWFHLQSITYDAKYYFPQKDSLEAVLGISGMNQVNENKGVEFLVPDYDLNDMGIFASIKKTFLTTTLNAGIRYDIREISGKELQVDSEEIFSSFKAGFSAFSGSVGTTWQPHEVWNFKFNIGRGFRSPNISELSANGLHEGTFRYEIGNHLLKPETSLQFDAGISSEWKKLSISLDGFYNRIDHFIYYRNTGNEMILVDGELYPVYRYTQGNSTLQGFELSFDFHPLNALHVESSLSYVEGENKSNQTPLPFIPPVKIDNELRYNFPHAKKSRLIETYIKVAVTNVLKQNKVDLFETETAGYYTLNSGAGTQIRMGRQYAIIFFNASNITDEKYFNHLSRLKETGIHEMGRNFTVGLTLPFGIKR